MAGPEPLGTEFSTAEVERLLTKPLITRGIELLHSQLAIAGERGIVHADISDVLAYAVNPRYLRQFTSQVRQPGEAFIARGRQDLFNVVQNPAEAEVLWVRGVIHQGVQTSLVTLLKELLGKEGLRALDGVQLMPSAEAGAQPSKVSLHPKSMIQERVSFRQAPDHKAVAQLLRV